MKSSLSDVLNAHAMFPSETDLAVQAAEEAAAVAVGGTGHGSLSTDTGTGGETETEAEAGAGVDWGTSGEEDDGEGTRRGRGRGEKITGGTCGRGRQKGVKSKLTGKSGGKSRGRTGAKGTGAGAGQGTGQSKGQGGGGLDGPDRYDPLMYVSSEDEWERGDILGLTAAHGAGAGPGASVGTTFKSEQLSPSGTISYSVPKRGNTFNYIVYSSLYQSR